MNNIEIIQKIKTVWKNGGNIIEYLKEINGRSNNSIEDILISYDFQSGSYIKGAKENPEFNFKYTKYIAKTLNSLGPINSIMEAGVGEATTLTNVLSKLNALPAFSYGFDISWSRIKYAIEYAKENNVKINLFVGDLFNIPLADNSVEIVYTSHSIEPNGGREIEALKELYRVAAKYLVLLEPTDEFANEEGKARMKRHGYIANLKENIQELGMNLIEYTRVPHISNPLNPTGLYIIEKNKDTIKEGNAPYVCPITKSILNFNTDHYFSKESFISYPTIGGIPCIMPQYGILTSKHE
jgi:ubiquinone/menaquinone biosynthesis C-methylase UbiE